MHGRELTNIKTNSDVFGVLQALDAERELRELYTNKEVPGMAGWTEEESRERRSKVEVEIEDIDHWSHGYCMNRSGNSKLYKSIADKIPDHWRETLRNIKATDQQARNVLEASGIVQSIAGCSSEVQSVAGCGPVPTPGQYWYVDARGLSQPRFVALPGMDQRSAYHGCSLSNLSSILSRGLSIGCGATQAGKKRRYGIYCEGGERKQLAFPYAAHADTEQSHPLILWAVVLELVVDKNRVVNVSGQWCAEADAVMVVGFYLHAINFLDTLDSRVVGKVNVLGRSLHSLLARAPRLAAHHSEWLQCLR